MKAIFSVLNKVLKPVSKIKSSEPILHSTTGMFVSKPKLASDTVCLAENTVGKFNLSVCDMPQVTSVCQNAIKNNADDLRIIYDLVKSGEVPKECAMKEISEILNKSYGLKVNPKIETGYRGAYAEYSEFLNKININETQSIDDIITHFSHEIQHYKQAIDINCSVSLKEKFRQIAIKDSENLSFRTALEKENFISQRTSFLEQIHKDAGWDNILAQYERFPQGSSGWQRGVEMYKSDCIPYHTQNHLGEIEAYTAGTSTYIELQKSVHKSITKREYDILNEINIVLHENYCEFSEDLRKLTVSINLFPESFVNHIKCAVRDLGMTDSAQIINEFLLPLMKI